MRIGQYRRAVSDLREYLWIHHISLKTAIEAVGRDRVLEPLGREIDPVRVYEDILLECELYRETTYRV